MFISRKPMPAAVRARGRRFVQLAERAHQAGQQAQAEYFIDLAYEVMRGYDALVLVDALPDRGAPGTVHVQKLPGLVGADRMFMPAGTGSVTCTIVPMGSATGPLLCGVST